MEEEIQWSHRHNRCMKTLGLIGPPTDTHINQRGGLIMDPQLTTRFYSRRTVQSCDDVSPVSRTSPTLWWCQSSFRWKSYVVMMSYTQQQLSLLLFHLLQNTAQIFQFNNKNQSISIYSFTHAFIYLSIYWFIHLSILIHLFDLFIHLFIQRPIKSTDQ